MKKHTLGSLIWLRLMRFTHQSNLLSNDILQRLDLTTAQFDVLSKIDNFERLTNSELAEHVTVTQGGISRMLSRLEKEELIVREKEWKTKTISLTEKGKNKLSRAFEAQLAFQTSFFDETLTKEEQKTLLTFISKVQKNSEEKMKNK